MQQALVPNCFKFCLRQSALLWVCRECLCISNFASFIGSESVHNLFYFLLFSKTVYWSASILPSKTCSLYFLYCVCLLTHRFLRRHIFLCSFWVIATCKVLHYASYVTFFFYLFWEVAHCNVFSLAFHVALSSRYDFSIAMLTIVQLFTPYLIRRFNNHIHNYLVCLIEVHHLLIRQYFVPIHHH